MYMMDVLTNDPRLTLVAAASCLTAVTLGWFINDYHAWKNFGTGGTAPNLQGYLKITKYRVLRAWSRDKLTDASKLPDKGISYLKQPLPLRQGPAPKIISRPLPQRQAPATIEADVYQRLHALPSLYAQKYPNLLLLDRSETEGRTTDAIYARPELPGRKATTQDPILGNEIAHVHPAENSLHVWLTLADTKKVVEAGWGQRFPLASLGMVNEGWTFVYAPRDMDEVDTIEAIVKAGIGHLTGHQL